MLRWGAGMEAVETQDSSPTLSTRETEGPHIGLIYEGSSGEEMPTTLTHACTPRARAGPHLPGCGRMPKGSLPSARGPAQSHACRSPASGPPTAHWERVRGSLGLVATPRAPNPGPHHSPSSGMLGCEPPRACRASPGLMPTVRECGHFPVWVCMAASLRPVVLVQPLVRLHQACGSGPSVQTQRMDWLLTGNTEAGRPKKGGTEAPRAVP